MGLKTKTMITQEQIEAAKKLLKDAGYFTDNLWHIDDVKSQFKCSDDEAYQLLKSVLDCEYNTMMLNEQIANDAGLFYEPQSVEN